MNANTSGDQARILNRPTTVEYGSTNTILYKTSRGLDFGTVRIREESTGSEFVMTEISTGLGIYSYNLIADWGLGSFTVSCTDPNASDSMVLEVISAGSGAQSVGSLASSISSMEAEIQRMSSVLQQLDEGGLSSLISSIGSSVDAVQQAVASGGGGGAGAVSQLEALVAGDGTGGGSSLVGQLGNMSSQISDIYGSASDAAKFALNAKNEAGNAVNAVRELRELLVSGGDASETKARLDAIKSAIDAANSNIEGIPKAVGATALHAQMREVAEKISEMAMREGYEYEVGLPGTPGAGGEAAADEEMITVLNQSMNEVKISLDFLEDILDEKINEPTVQIDYLGVE
jgi:hypothetical protein